jgi:hypothetical protein
MILRQCSVLHKLSIYGKKKVRALEIHTMAYSGDPIIADVQQA